MEKDEEITKSKETGEEEEAKREGKNVPIVKKMKTLFDFSVWKEPRVIALILGAYVVKFGHLVPQIHLVTKLPIYCLIPFILVPICVTFFPSDSL